MHGAAVVEIVVEAGLNGCDGVLLVRRAGRGLLTREGVVKVAILKRLEPLIESGVAPPTKLDATFEAVVGEGREAGELAHDIEHAGA